MVAELLKLVEKLSGTYVLTFIVLFGVGALFVATAATGGWPEFGIAVSEPWRYMIAGCGILFLIAAIVFLFLERRITLTLPSKEKAGVSIDYPRDGMPVVVPCQVTGRLKSLPRGISLWLFTISGHGKGVRYFPQDEVRVTDDRSWQTELRATNFNDGDKRRFAIFLVGENGQVLIHHFKIAGQAINAIESKSVNRPWPGITLLTSDIVQSTDIREISISHSARKNTA